MVAQLRDISPALGGTGAVSANRSGEAVVDALAPGEADGEVPAGEPPMTPAAGHHVTTAKVTSAARWMAVSQVSIQLTRFAVYVLLARLLLPSAFGLVAMATVVVSFLEVFRGLGTSEAVVQRPVLTRRMTSSIFYANIVLGALASGVLIALAPVIASIYHSPHLTPILQVLSLNLFIVSSGETQQGLLRRELRFGAVAVTTIGSAVAIGLVSGILAGLGAGPWALVGGTLAGGAALTALSWITSPWRPTREFSFADLRAVSGFSVNYSGVSIVTYFLVNADKFLVGRYLGAIPLGFYSMAQRILAYPMGTISGALQEVLFPTFSRVQDADDRFRAGYLRACGAIAFLCLPLTAGLAVTAHDAIEVLLGSRWLPVVPLAEILAPVGGVQAIFMTTGIILSAKGRADRLLWFSTLNGAVAVAGYFIGLQWGLVGLCVSFAITAPALDIPACLVSFPLIGLKLKDFLWSLAPYAGATLAMTGVVAAVQWALHRAGLASLQTLAICVATGFVVYVGIALLLRLPAVEDFRQFINVRRAAPSDPNSAPAT
jgi:O-antigen/teichoic acid export membrane protein